MAAATAAATKAGVAHKQFDIFSFLSLCLCRYSFLMKILCCGIFPALQRTLELKTLKIGAVNRVRSVAQSVGGKATHAARVLKTLGVCPAEGMGIDPLLVGFAGGENGEAIRRLLTEESIEHAFVETEAETRVCQTLLAGDADDFTEIIEDTAPLSSKDWKNLVQKFQPLEKESDAIILSGTLPAHVPQAIYSELLRGTENKTVIIDTSGAPLLAALEHRPTLVKINASELQSASQSDDRQSGLPFNLKEAAQELMAQGAGAVGITQGAGSALLVTPKETIECSIPKVEVKSTLGCGDSVNAGIAFALQKESSLTEAFVFGLACGAANAQTAMPGVVDPAAVATLAQQIKIY